VQVPTPLQSLTLDQLDQQLHALSFSLPDNRRKERVLSKAADYFYNLFAASARIQLSLIDPVYRQHKADIRREGYRRWNRFNSIEKDRWSLSALCSANSHL
jgi:hypothetical protein